MRYVINTLTVRVVEHAGEFYCYGRSGRSSPSPDKLLRVCPSEGLARAVVAGL